MIRDDDRLRQRDWVGWVVAAIMTLVAALSGIVWNQQNQRVIDLQARLDELQRTGTPAMRAEMAGLHAQVTAMQSQIDGNTRSIEYLLMISPTIRRESGASSSNPRFGPP